MSKLDVRSVIERDGHIYAQNDDISRLFAFKPNPLQTTSDFIASIEWVRCKNGNAFIYPQYELLKQGHRTYKRYTALYPLNPLSIRFGIDDGQPILVEFTFSDGSQYTIPYHDLIHMKWRRGANMISGGGNDDGLLETRDILRTLESLDKTIQGLPKSIEASMQINGVFSAKTVADNKNLEKMRNDFESHLKTSKAGILATDFAADFTPINMNTKAVPESTMKFLKSVIQERYGVSAAILSGDYDTNEHNAFYQTVIEDFINQFEQAFSYALFTQRERDVGHRIRCSYNKVSYMSAQEKIELSNLAKTTGILTLNQIAELFGYPAFEEGNRRLQSLNYVDINLIDAYQLDEGSLNAKKTRPKDDD